MSVYFHANFNLNRDRLAGVLEALITHPELNENQIAKPFGYRAPFTKRYKSWLKKCGVIENSTRVKLTDYGSIIFNKDSKLKKPPTLWYMHSQLVKSEENAEAWHYFYNSYLPKHKSFNKHELSDALSMKLMAHDPGHFGKNAPMIKVITKVLIDSYISKNAFRSLGIVEFKDGDFIRGNSDVSIKWDNVESFVKLY